MCALFRARTLTSAFPRAFRSRLTVLIALSACAFGLSALTGCQQSSSAGDDSATHGDESGSTQGGGNGGTDEGVSIAKDTFTFSYYDGDSGWARHRLSVDFPTGTLSYGYYARMLDSSALTANAIPEELDALSEQLETADFAHLTELTADCCGPDYCSGVEGVYAVSTEAMALYGRCVSGGTAL